jgi:hypothetical protein
MLRETPQHVAAPRVPQEVRNILRSLKISLAFRNGLRIESEHPWQARPNPRNDPPFSSKPEHAEAPRGQRTCPHPNAPNQHAKLPTRGGVSGENCEGLRSDEVASVLYVIGT